MRDLSQASIGDLFWAHAPAMDACDDPQRLMIVAADFATTVYAATGVRFRPDQLASDFLQRMEAEA